MPVPPPVVAEPTPGPGMTEVDKIKQKQKTITNESLTSTQMMVQLLDQTKGVGIKTLIALDEQGEQLALIEQNVTTINEEMSVVRRTLLGLKNSIFWYIFCECCGLCELPWSKKSTKENDKVWKSNDDGKVVTNQPHRQGGRRVVPPGGYIPKITNDASEDQMEQNLEQVSAMIGTIRNIACDIGGEITSQNQQLDQINGKVAYDQMEVESATKTTEKLVGHHR